MQDTIDVTDNQAACMQLGGGLMRALFVPLNTRLQLENCSS